MKKVVWILSSFALVLPAISFAQSGPTCIPGSGPFNPGCVTKISQPSDIINLLLGIVYLVQTIFWILTIGMIFYAAYLYLFGGAGEKNVLAAKSALKYAVIGMVIALLATATPWLIRSILQF